MICCSCPPPPPVQTKAQGTRSYGNNNSLVEGDKRGQAGGEGICDSHIFTCSRILSRIFFQGWSIVFCVEGWSMVIVQLGLGRRPVMCLSVM